MKHFALLSLVILLLGTFSVKSQENPTNDDTYTERYREMPSAKNIVLMEGYSILASLYASHPDFYGDVVLGYTYTGISAIALAGVPVSLLFNKNKRNKWLDASTMLIVSAGALVNSRYNLDWGTSDNAQQKFVRNLIDHNLIFASAIFIPYLLDGIGKKKVEDNTTAGLNVYFGGNTLCMTYRF